MTTIPLSVFKTSGDGFDFSLSGDSLLVGPNFTVLSETLGDGVNSSIFFDEAVLNKGAIYGADSTFSSGIVLRNGSSSVTNSAGALIFGELFGVVLEGNGIDAVFNYGTVTGKKGNGVFIGGAPASVSINNFGYIYGSGPVILLGDHTVGGTIVNGGEITTNIQTAIDINTESTLVTEISNLSFGVISGITAINAHVGIFNLNNQGVIFGDIIDEDNGNDVITNPGHINGNVFLGGNSVFNGTGGTSGPIHVGSGNATVTGGSGADQFVFDSALTGQFTKITNFATKQHDKIVLSEVDFPNIGPLGKLTLSHFDNGKATHAHPEIVYTPGNDFLYYDSNGNHHGGLHHIATLFSHLTNASFIVEA